MRYGHKRNTLGRFALLLAAFIVCASMFSMMIANETNENKLNKNLITGFATGSSDSLTTDEPVSDASYPIPSEIPSDNGGSTTEPIETPVKTSDLSVMDEPLNVQAIHTCMDLNGSNPQGVYSIDGNFTATQNPCFRVIQSSFAKPAYLYCGGHEINAQGGLNDIFLDNSGGYSYVHLVDCVIKNFDRPIYSTGGVNLRAEENRFYGGRIEVDSSTDFYLLNNPYVRSQVYLTDSSGSFLTGNNFAQEDGNPQAGGIRIQSSSNNYVRDNTNVTGIFIYWESDGNHILHNQVNGGIGLLTRCDSNEISENRLNGSISIEDNCNGNTFTNNAIRSTNYDFTSTDSSGNIIENMAFNSSNSPTTASFVYGGNIAVDSADEIASLPTYSNVGKFLNITNSSAAWIFLNISYTQETNERSLKMYRYNGAWSLANTTSSINRVDTENNVVYANITSFSTFAPLGIPDVTAPVVNLVSPLNKSMNGYNSLNFTCNITDDGGIANLSLYIWDSDGNEGFSPSLYPGYSNVDLTGLSNETTWEIRPIDIEGTYTWNCLGYDTSGHSSWSSEGNYTFTQDNLNVTGCKNLTTENATYYLNNYVNSSGTCFNVLANNITLDCNENMINYSQSETGYGINLTGFNNTTIRNCTIVQGNSSNSNSGGIIISSSAGNSILDNQIITLGESSPGVRTEGTDSTRNLIERNNISTSKAYAYGIIMNYDSGWNDVTENAISTVWAATSGVYLDHSSHDNFYSNNISTQGYQADGVFIYYGQNNNFSSNNIDIYSADVDGIAMFSSQNDNVIEFNRIYSHGYSARGLSISGFYNNVSSNIVTMSEDSSYWTFALGGTAYDSIFFNNTFITSGSTSYSLSVSSFGRNNFTGNILQGNNSKYIYTSGAGDDNNFTDTTFRTSDGSLRFPNKFVMNSSSPEITTSNLNISNKKIHMNSSRLNFLNTSAEITLYGLTGLTNPEMMVSRYDNATNETCPVDVCQNVSWDGSTFVFNVTHFTTYFVQGSSTPPVDSTPPLSITNLANQSSGQTWIYWNWTNPDDSDFNSTILIFDNVNVVNLTSGINYYNATTGLTCGTSHNLTIKTKDNSSNVNNTAVTNISRTLSCSDVPPSATNVSACGFPFLANHAYTLNKTVNSVGTCFDITADNVTLDCRGFNITGDASASSYGINIDSRNGMTIKNCIITNFYAGIRVYGSSSNNLINNTVSSNSWSGIVLWSSYNTTLINNTISSSSYAINLVDGVYTIANHLIINNNVSSNNLGISIGGSSNNTLINNNFNYNQNGIHIGRSFNNTLLNNTITKSSDQEGLRVKQAGPGMTLADFQHNITESNKINGKPIYYHSSTYGGCPSPVNADTYSWIGLVDCANVNVTGTLNNDIEQVLLASTNWTNVTGVNVTAGTQTGFFFYSSSYNQIKDSYVSSKVECLLLNESSNNNSFVSSTIDLTPYYGDERDKYLFVDATSSGNDITNVSFYTDWDVVARFPDQITLPTGGDINWDNLWSTPVAIGLNSTDIPFMNHSAEITFYRIYNMTAPIKLIEVDSDVPRFSECTESDGCNILYYDKQSRTLIFNVSHFTVYDVLGSPVADATGDYDCSFTNSTGSTFSATMQLIQNDFNLSGTFDIPEAGMQGSLDAFVGGYEDPYGPFDIMGGIGTAGPVKLLFEGQQAPSLLQDYVGGTYGVFSGNDYGEWSCMKRAAAAPVSGGGGGGGGGGGVTVTPTPQCEENWQCSEWSACSNGQQTKTCSDLKKCGTTTNRPALSQACEVPAVIPPVVVPKSSAWIFYLVALGMALVALGYVVRQKIIERMLVNRIGMMEHFVEIKDMENAKNVYRKLIKTYQHATIKNERMYHDKIIGLYQKALGFN